MVVTFVVAVDLDAEAIARAGTRLNYSFEQSRAVAVADLEDRLDGAVRHREAVVRVGISLASDTPAGYAA